MENDPWQNSQRTDSIKCLVDFSGSLNFPKLIHNKFKITVLENTREKRSLKLRTKAIVKQHLRKHVMLNIKNAVNKIAGIQMNKIGARGTTHGF